MDRAMTTMLLSIINQALKTGKMDVIGKVPNAFVPIVPPFPKKKTKNPAFEYFNNYNILKPKTKKKGQVQ